MSLRIQNLDDSRYFSKYEVCRKYEKFKDWFSEKELFLSDCYESISPQLLQGKANVLSFEEYDLQKEIGRTTYFTR